MIETDYTILDRLDWDLFIERYWDRRPVLFRGVGATGRTPFVLDEVFTTLTAAAAPDAAGEIPRNVRFAVGRDLKRTSAELDDDACSTGWMPQPGDGSLRGYARRLTGDLGGRRYSLTVQALHLFDYPLWRRARAFYADLFARVGLPVSGAITAVFHGNYEHSQVGVHRDRFATFMFGLEGRKRMRFWPSCPWTEPVTSIIDYERHVPDSFSVEVRPGDLLYWPSSYYHVGESSLDPEPATSANVGVPRDFTRADFDAAEFLATPTVASMFTDDLDPERFTAPEAPMFDPGSGTALPLVLREALTTVRQAAEETALRDWSASLSLKRWTAGGFYPPPPPMPPTPLTLDTTVVGDPDEPILWHDTATARIIGAAGHNVSCPLSAGTVSDLVRRLRNPVPHTVADLIAPLPEAERAEATRTLAELVRFRALRASVPFISRR